MVRTQDRITRFLSDHSHMSRERIEKLMLNPTELVKRRRDPFWRGRKQSGRTDRRGGRDEQALRKLHEMIDQERAKKQPK